MFSREHEGAWYVMKLSGRPLAPEKAPFLHVFLKGLLRASSKTIRIPKKHFD